MRAASFFVAILMAALVGCTSNPRQRTTDAPDTASDGQPVQNNQGSAKPTGSASMSAGFAKAHSSFRDHAAQTLGTGPDAVEVVPQHEQIAKVTNQFLGKLWEFTGSAGERQVRGWATSEGVVVTHQQNLGLLFEEAGIWTGAPTLTAKDLADRIAWSMGAEHRVLIEPSLKLGEPSLQVGADGAGTLKFFVGYKQLGPGGAGGGPEQVAECTVSLTPDHKAQLQRGEWRGR